MKWYVYALIFLIFLFVYMFLQSLLYKTRYYTIPTRKGVRFLHLTDIHIGLLFVSAKRMKKTAERVNPDYILISGDLIDKPGHLDKLVRWFKTINPKVPVFCVLGNHDHRCFKKNPSFFRRFMTAMEELNIRLLNNEVVFLDGKKGCASSPPFRAIALVGMDDCKTGTPVKREIFQNLREKSDCIVAFSHNPDISLRIPENSVDLLITGHFHGGQMWMPFNLEYLLLRRDRVSRMGYYKGFATIRNNRVYISRGLGTVLVPFRFLSVPEVTVFDV